MDEKIFIYIATIEEFKDYDILPSFAIKEIAKTTNEKVINQKRAVWGLLNKAVKEKFGFIDDFSHIEKNKNGKPISNKYFLSISHSKDIVAVAIANENIGIDIEKIDSTKNINKIKKYILSEDEEILNIEDLFKIWTKKEALFKFEGGEKFIPKNIKISNIASKNFIFTNADDKYCLSVISNNLNNIEVNSLIN